jgi:hypothetical protein
VDLFPCVGSDHVCCGGFPGEKVVRLFCVLNLSMPRLQVSTGFSLHFLLFSEIHPLS